MYKQKTLYRISNAEKIKPINLTPYSEFGNISLGEARTLKNVLKKFFRIEIEIEKKKNILIYSKD